MWVDVCSVCLLCVYVHVCLGRLVSYRTYMTDINHLCTVISSQPETVLSPLTLHVRSTDCGRIATKYTVVLRPVLYGLPVHVVWCVVWWVPLLCVVWWVPLLCVVWWVPLLCVVWWGTSTVCCVVGTSTVCFVVGTSTVCCVVGYLYCVLCGGVPLLCVVW